MKSRIAQVFLAFCLAGLPSLAQTFRPALLITHTDGSSVKYCLENLPKLTFQTENLSVSYQGETVTYGRTDIASLTYVDDPQIPSGIGAVDAQQSPAVTFYDDALSVYTASPVPLAVYTLSGRSVWSSMSAAGSPTRLEFGSLTPGVYVLKCGSHAYKFVVR